MPATRQTRRAEERFAAKSRGAGYPHYAQRYEGFPRPAGKSWPNPGTREAARRLARAALSEAQS